jgi:hypothetical protein
MPALPEKTFKVGCMKVNQVIMSMPGETSFETTHFLRSWDEFAITHVKVHAIVQNSMKRSALILSNAFLEIRQ